MFGIFKLLVSQALAVSEPSYKAGAVDSLLHEKAVDELYEKPPPMRATNEKAVHELYEKPPPPMRADTNVLQTNVPSFGDVTLVLFDMDNRENWDQKYFNLIKNTPDSETSLTVYSLPFSVNKLLDTENDSKIDFAAFIISENEVIGYALAKVLGPEEGPTYYRAFDNMVYIDDVEILQEYQGKGLCKPLVSFLIGGLKKKRPP